MADDFDTSWFDLKKYDKLSEYSLHAWFHEISIRNFNLTHLINLDVGTGFIKHSEVSYERIKISPLTDAFYECGEECQRKSQRFPFNTFSVRSTEVSTFLDHARDIRLDDIWSQCDYACDSPREQQELVDTPLNLIYKERGYDEYSNNFMTSHFVTVDLTASDTQIMSDFRHWLTEYRNVIGVESNKKKFTQVDIERWINYCVIPYLDLMLIAKIEGKKITQNQLARLIFPNEFDVDIVGRLRQVTMPEAKRLMDSGWDDLMLQVLREH